MFSIRLASANVIGDRSQGLKHQLRIAKAHLAPAPRFVCVPRSIDLQMASPGTAATAESDTAANMQVKLKSLYANAKSPQDIFPDVPPGAILMEKIMDVWGALV
jgi:hypothetical protein